MAQAFNTKTTSLDTIKTVIHDLGTEAVSDVIRAVKEIITNVKSHGDDAVVEYTNKFDHQNVASIKELKVSEAEIEAAYAACTPKVIEALTHAAKRIAAYHTKQMPQNFDYIDEDGVRLGNIWKPIQNIGLYVPGGKASYPSSVLMNAIPAKIAGAVNLVMVVPAPGGVLNPAVLAAAKIAGITEIYKIGGAQAIAALAFNNTSIPSVDKIVGPGNAYVAAAKRELSNIVGIDMIAGPSEILVIADNKTDPKWIAADLLSQAEHDENAQSILITNDEIYASAVITAVEDHLKTLSRADIAHISWNNKGVVVVDPGFANTIELINYIAPEHLELAIENANEMAKHVHNAGAIFLGRYTPEAIGDYTAGPSHVLPTSGTARFASGLSVFDFLKRVSLIECSKESFAKLADSTACLADSEGLDAHALSVRIRK